MLNTTRSLMAAASALLFVTALHAGDFTFKFPPAKPAQDNGRKICIRNLQDLREFEDRPARAETPSLAAGKDNTDESTRRRAVARVRDGYGKARSNVFLGEKENVMTTVRQLLSDALAAKGYTVVEEAKADRQTLMVDVGIKKFWGWINVNAGGGFTGSGTMMMTVDIETDLAMEKGWLKEKKSTTVSNRVELRLGIGVTGRAWQNTFLKAFEEYQARIGKIEI